MNLNVFIGCGYVRRKLEAHTVEMDGQGDGASHRDGPPAKKPWVALSFDFVVPLIY